MSGYNPTAPRTQDDQAMTTTILDLTGLKCPLPALLTRKALLRLAPADRLEVHCSDPMAIIDIPAMVQQNGDRLESSERRFDLIIFIIAKCNRPIAHHDQDCCDATEIVDENRPGQTF